MIISMGDYAKSKGISYEAVRRQVAKYRDELGEHCFRQNGSTYLDEEGVAFLDGKRRLSPVIVVQENQSQQLEEQEQKIAELRNRLDVLRDELARSQAQVIELQTKQIALIEDQTKYRLLLTDHEAVKEELEQIQTERDAARAEAAEAQAEAASYHKSWFGFYRRH